MKLIEALFAIEVRTLKALRALITLDKLEIIDFTKTELKMELYNVIVFSNQHGEVKPAKFKDVASIDRLVSYLNENIPAWDYMNVYSASSRQYLRRIYRAEPKQPP